MTPTATRPLPDAATSPGTAPGRLVVLGGPRALPSWVYDCADAAGARAERGPAGVREQLPVHRAGGTALATIAALGRNAMVLLLPGAPVAVPGRLVAAVRDHRDAAVLRTAGDLALCLDAPVELVHAVPVSFGEHSVGMAEALGRGTEALSRARERLAARCPAGLVRSRLARSWPHEAFGSELDADLLVIGGPADGGRLGLVAGSALQHAACPVLLVPRRSGAGWEQR